MSTAAPITDRTPATILPSDPRIDVANDAYHRRMSLAHPHLYTLVNASLDDTPAFYLLHEGLALGPIPEHLCHDGHWRFREAIACEDLAALGLSWAPLPAEAKPSPNMWYQCEDGPAGGRYISIVAGYNYALRAFLASGEARSLPALAGAMPRGIVPYLTLHPDGRWETGAEGTAQPVVLALRDREDLATVLDGELEDALYDRTWPM